ncbi:hypothetical protein, unknown function [Leishmania mexicana MHOM/GT/2001/U1103]|uniref:Uncharacterized protein n=1 Tax=Leishmania mexicana (strain MHOM/GT/2001/U1103) TaxID=929439 RepID=E9B6B8_LEIMU|nr:hypothetical protein, unknown function [Leishmania mexicana MHOM/GT/2001/U1103]CBZ30790.1 hypothetical protein, unknown function [Leishmania mexicana MHOM/GT/2001/U1103]
MSGSEGTGSGSAAGLSSSTNTNCKTSTSARNSGNNTKNSSISAGKKPKGSAASAAMTSETCGDRSGYPARTSISPTPTSDGGSVASLTAATAGSSPSKSPPTPTETIGAMSAESVMTLHSPAETPGRARKSSQAFATSLVNLEVKVLTQALGAENQWAEQGDGRVVFSDFTIRVIASGVGKDEEQKEKAAGLTSSGAADAATANGNGDVGAAPRKGVATSDVSALSNTVSEFEEDDTADESIILEDTINNDTPFVGENCCIVWNSFEKQLSLCLMYASEEGYSASWSALVALQDKSYPPFRFDLLGRCRPVSERTALAPGDSTSSVSPSTAATDKTEEVVLPYSYFIHTKYDPPLGFIEHHALSLSIIEHHHATNPALYADKETVLKMLNMANADLLDYLISEDTFPLLLSGLQCTATPWSWSVQEPLRLLQIPDEVITLIRKDRWIGFLQNTVLPSCGPADSVTELIAKYATMSRRIRNDIVCTLLTCDSMFSEACEALRVVPQVTPATMSGGTSARNRGLSVEASLSATSLSSEGRCSMSAVGNGAPSPMSTPPALDTVPPAQKAELQVLAHLRFFHELVTLSIAELGREMVGPIVGKIYQSGLLEPLSLVAERFAMPSGTAAAFAKHIMDGSGGALNDSRRGGGGGSTSNSNSAAAGGTSSTANYYSLAVEQELAAVLDVTLVRLNERQEEQLMNEHVRSPILADPLRYNGIVTFMLRQLIMGGPIGPTFATSGTGTSSTRPSLSIFPPPKRILRDSMSSTNPFALFHVLGLHDDEGSAATERKLDFESTGIRNQFHNFIITKYIAHATRGVMTPVPLPPSLGGVVGSARNMPIVQFNNANASQNGGARPVHQEANGSSTGNTTVVVPNTCPAAGGGGACGGSGAASPVLPLPQGITPALVRVLEYMVNLTNNANRELILKTVFHYKSHIWHFVEGVCDILCGANGAGGRCQVGLDVLCGCVRFLKVVVMQMTVTTAEVDENPMSTYASSREPLSPQLVTTICRQLTVERDTFGYLLKAYNALGGRRRNSVFHSSLLSVLDIIGKHSAHEPEDSTTNNLRDVRDYFFFKHFTRLPEVFACRYREALLSEVTVRLGQEATHSPNDSVSVLSSTTGSELTRCSSKLRFVDEVDAVSGGVDGTVVPSSVVNPAIMVSMANAEEKQRRRNGRSSMEQWNAATNLVMVLPSQVRSVTSFGLADDHGGRASSSSSPANRKSSPLTISISRPGSGSNSSGGSAGSARAPAGDLLNAIATQHNDSSVNDDGPLAQASPSSTVGPNARKTDTVLRPTAPKEEKPPVRPRNFASVLENPSRTNAAASGEQGSKSRSMPNATAKHTPPSPEEVLLSRSGQSSVPQGVEHANGTALPSNDNVVLPKIKPLSTGGKRS